MARYPQTLTRWTSTADGYGGFTFDAPEYLKGRWEDKAIQVRTPSGDEITSKSVVYVESDVNIGDYLYLGESYGADPTEVAGAGEVQAFLKIPDLRGFDFDRKAIL